MSMNTTGRRKNEAGKHGKTGNMFSSMGRPWGVAEMLRRCHGGVAQGLWGVAEVLRRCRGGVAHRPRDPSQRPPSHPIPSQSSKAAPNAKLHNSDANL